MFIVTAQLVKPVNPDALPQMRGVDGLKNGSPLGVEPKSEEIQGRTGFSVTGQATEEKTEEKSVAPKAVEPAKTAAPADSKDKTGDTTSTTTTTSQITPAINPNFRLARVMSMDPGPQPPKP